MRLGSFIDGLYHYKNYTLILSSGVWRKAETRSVGNIVTNCHFAVFADVISHKTNV